MVRRLTIRAALVDLYMSHYIYPLSYGVHIQVRVAGGSSSKLSKRVLIKHSLHKKYCASMNLLLSAFRGEAGGCLVQLNTMVMQVQEQRAGLQMQNTCSVGWEK